jgi:hypothetical protein
VKDYFPRTEFQRLGMSEVAIRALEKIADFVQAQQELMAAQEDIVTNADAIDLANTDITAANVAINALDARIDAYDALDPFVRQDQTAAWADPTGTLARTTFAAYAGQTVTNPPTQAEVQAIDDHLKVISQRFAAAITDLRTINAFT